MTEKQALILDVVVGYVVTMGGVVLLDRIGVNGTLVALAGMIGLSVTCLLIGAIDVHYTRKAIERGEDPDEL
jgi:hypothetical protein